MVSQNQNTFFTLNESLNLVYTGLDGLRKSMDMGHLAFNALITPVKELGRAVQEANNLQKQSLAIDKTLAGLTEGNNAALASLRGGFAENTQSLIELRSAGFDKLNPATLQLATFMRNTGQSTQGLMKLNQLLFNQGGLTENSLNSLSENLMYTSTAYNITTTDLIGAVQELSGKMGTFGQLGIAGPLSDAVIELTGRMGAQFGSTIGKFASVLADPATSSSLLQRLGLLEIARDIRAGTLSPSQMTERLSDAISIGARQTQALTGGAGGELGEVFTALLGIAGGEGGLGQMALQLNRAGMAPEGPEQVLANQMRELNILFSEIGEPLKEMGAILLPPIVDILTTLKTPLKILVATLFPALIGVATTLLTVQATRFAITTAQWVATQIQGKTLIGAIGSLIGATHGNTIAQTKSATAALAAGGVIGILLGAVVGIGTMAASMSSIAKSSEESLQMEKDKFHNEQRRQQMDVASTNSFLQMAKAISSDAGIAMAFRPDLLDPIRRDEVARSVIDYLDEIARGVATPAPTDVGLIIGATP